MVTAAVSVIAQKGLCPPLIDRPVIADQLRNVEIFGQDRDTDGVPRLKKELGNWTSYAMMTTNQIGTFRSAGHSGRRVDRKRPIVSLSLD
jgi:hypothetical protein